MHAAASGTTTRVRGEGDVIIASRYHREHRVRKEEVRS
jgi:hypothetical protein